MSDAAAYGTMIRLQVTSRRQCCRERVAVHSRTTAARSRQEAASMRLLLFPLPEQHRRVSEPRYGPA